MKITRKLRVCVRGHQWGEMLENSGQRESSFLLEPHRRSWFSELGMVPRPCPVLGRGSGWTQGAVLTKEVWGESAGGLQEVLCSHRRHEEGMLWPFDIVIWGHGVWICRSHLVTWRGMIYRPKMAEKKVKRKLGPWWVYWAAKLSKFQNYSTFKCVKCDDKFPLWLNHF